MSLSKLIFIGVLISCGQAFADDSFEDNDTFAQASTISLGTLTNLEAEDDDWYRISAQPGTLFVEVQHPEGSGLGDLNVTLNDTNGNALFANFAVGSPESFTFDVQIAGDFLIRVFKTSALNNTYQLTVSDSVTTTGDDNNDNGGNDNITAATSITSNSIVTDQISLDDDWFGFDVFPGFLTIQVDFAAANGDLFVELYDGSFTRLAFSAVVPTGRQIEIPVVAADRYYLSINSISGNSYDLSTFSPTVWAFEYPFGPIRSSSITLADVDGDGRDEILVGTSKALNPNTLAERKPAALLCIEDDGRLKWSREFPAIVGPDPQTGLTYSTSSVTSTPAVGDIDDDGILDIVIGTGADIRNDAGGLVVGQPGDLGALYALDAATGNQKWVNVSKDIIGGTENIGEGRPDGVLGTALIVDIDDDGNTEVVYGAWDRNMYVLNGATGVPKPGWPFDVLDTIWSSPVAADIDNDNELEILISADITENPAAGTITGGIFHVFNPLGGQDTPGFNAVIGNPDFNIFGKLEDEPLWSSPAVADFDGDGEFEIAYGGGNFSGDPTKGDFIRVWEHDGTSKFLFDTDGKTFASPSFVDIDGDGDLELIAATLDGVLYAWDHNGNELFRTLTDAFPANNGVEPIFGTPIAVDIDEDNRLEFLFPQAAALMIVDDDGQQLIRSDVDENFVNFTGSPAINDIDNDGVLDIISGGTNKVATSPFNLPDTAAVYRYRFGRSTTNGVNNRFGRRMFREPVLPSGPSPIVFRNGFE